MPTSVEPVRVMASTSGLVQSQLPTLEPRPVTIWMAPGVTPASPRSAVRRQSVSGLSVDGFTITALPARRAGATFWSKRSHGKLKGMTAAMTPRGSRRVMRMWCSWPASMPAGMVSP